MNPNCQLRRASNSDFHIIKNLIPYYVYDFSEIHGTGTAMRKDASTAATNCRNTGKSRSIILTSSWSMAKSRDSPSRGPIPPNPNAWK